MNVIATEHAQSGGCIAAPTTYNSENGYVFANCLITADGFQQGTYYLARGWQNSPAAIFVLTKFAANPSSKYWGANINALTSRRFAALSIVQSRQMQQVGLHTRHSRMCISKVAM